MVWPVQRPDTVEVSALLCRGEFMEGSSSPPSGMLEWDRPMVYSLHVEVREEIAWVPPGTHVPCVEGRVGWPGRSMGHRKA